MDHEEHEFERLLQSGRLAPSIPTGLRNKARGWHAQRLPRDIGVHAPQSHRGCVWERLLLTRPRETSVWNLSLERTILVAGFLSDSFGRRPYTILDLRDGQAPVRLGIERNTCVRRSVTLVSLHEDGTSDHSEAEGHRDYFRDDTGA